MEAFANSEQVTLLNVAYHNVTVPEALNRCLELIREDARHNVFFLNLDCLRIAQADAEYRDILRQTPLVLPDGIGLRVVTEIFGGHMRDNCNGSDFSPLLLRECAKAGLKVFFYGGEEGVAEKAAEMMRKKIPDLKIVGVEHGFVGNGHAIEKINASGADVLFAGLGVPLQEKWIVKYREFLAPKLCLGVGALFDWLSGNKVRCPQPFRALSLEWLWRIGIEPGRMSKRYVIDDMPFLAKLCIARILPPEGRKT